jgi:multiple sugar transport system substrate-binding protein
MALGLVGIATTAALLAGCSSSDAPSGSVAQDEGDGPITLEYWAWGTTQDPLVDAWNKAHPDIQVRHTDVGGGSDTSSKLVTATRAKNAADVALVEYNTLPSMIVAGVAADITEYADDVKDDFAPGVWNQASFGGVTYGIPQDAGPQVLTYNKKRFDELGVSVPTTWAEFADAAVQVHEADPNAYITTFAPAEFGGFAGYAQQAGAEWWKVDGDAWTVNFDDQPSIDVANYWQDLVDTGVVKAEPLLTPEWNASLNAGEILSWPAGLWAGGVINGVAADMAGDWAIAPLPQWTEGDASVAFQGGSAAIVTTSSKHQKAAAEFAKWIATADEASQVQIEQGTYPASIPGQQLTIGNEPPLLMTGQDDYWEIAAEVTANTIPEISWGPNVNVASTAFQDALSAAVTEHTSFADALTATEKVVVDDMTSQGFDVAEG